MSGPQRVIRVPVYWLVVGVAMVVLSPFLALTAAVTISNRSLGESERKWCSIVVTLDDAYRQAPPQTAPGQSMAQGIADLRRSLDCPA